MISVSCSDSLRPLFCPHNDIRHPIPISMCGIWPALKRRNKKECAESGLHYSPSIVCTQKNSKQRRAAYPLRAVASNSRSFKELAFTLTKINHFPTAWRVSLALQRYLNTDVCVTFAFSTCGIWPALERIAPVTVTSGVYTSYRTLSQNQVLFKKILSQQGAKYIRSNSQRQNVTMPF